MLAGETRMLECWVPTHSRIRDLKGRTVAVPARIPPPLRILATSAAYVGLDPRKASTMG